MKRFILLCQFLCCHAWPLDSFNRPSCRTIEPSDSSGFRMTPALDASTQKADAAAPDTARSQNGHTRQVISRRQVVSHVLTSSLMLGSISSGLAAPTQVAEARVTNRIFLDVAGLPGGPSDDEDSASSPANAQRLVIGLFGDQAPDATNKILQLVSPLGLAIPCRPKAVRDLQREQLQANAVYKRCMESQEQGVSWKDSTIWRIIPGQRVDVGAVSGKFLARQYPEWSDVNELLHDAVGVVSVRRGNQGGFGFTISLSSDARANAELDELNVVVGRVLDGWNALGSLNQVPVVKAANLNYMALTGGSSNKDAPSRSCTYGGPLYCNENKPLIKLTVINCGVLQ